MADSIQAMDVDISKRHLPKRTGHTENTRLNVVVSVLNEIFIPQLKIYVASRLEIHFKELEKKYQINSDQNSLENPEEQGYNFRYPTNKRTRSSISENDTLQKRAHGKKPTRL